MSQEAVFACLFFFCYLLEEGKGIMLVFFQSVYPIIIKKDLKKPIPTPCASSRTKNTVRALLEIKEG